MNKKSYISGIALFWFFNSCNGNFWIEGKDGTNEPNYIDSEGDLIIVEDITGGEINGEVFDHSPSDELFDFSDAPDGIDVFDSDRAISDSSEISPSEEGNCRGSSGTYFESIETPSGTRYYALHVPASYDGCSPVPLLIFFHGTDISNVGDPRGNENSSMLYTRLNSNAELHGYIVAYPTARAVTGPSGTALAWCLPFMCDVEADDAFTEALIEKLTSDFNIDSGRIYIVGFSQGGFYVSHLFPRYYDIFAGFSIHGAVCASSVECPGSPPRKMPGFIRIGSEDAVVDFNGDGDSTAEAEEFHRQLISAGWQDGVNLNFEVVDGAGHTYFSSLNEEQWNFLSSFTM